MDDKILERKSVSFFIRYGSTLLLVGFALAVTLFIWSFINSLSSPLFLLAIGLATWKNGFRAGVLATVISAWAINYFVLAPQFQLHYNTQDVLRIIVFSLEGGFVCWIVNWRTNAVTTMNLTAKKLKFLTQNQQRLIESERKRLALDIHDELGQSLTALKMQIHNLQKRLERKSSTEHDSTLNENFIDLYKLTDQTIASVRRISTELRPPILDDLGLIAAIEWQAGEFQKKTGIKCETTKNVEAVAADSDFSVAVFRIFQESLTNILRHSDTKSVNIEIRKRSDQLFLQVEDFGEGMSTSNNNNSSLGILGMRQRAEMIGGELKILSEKNKGTRVLLTAPITE